MNQGDLGCSLPCTNKQNNQNKQYNHNFLTFLIQLNIKTYKSADKLKERRLQQKEIVNLIISNFQYVIRNRSDVTQFFPSSVHSRCVRPIYSLDRSEKLYFLCSLLHVKFCLCSIVILLQ